MHGPDIGGVMVNQDARLLLAQLAQLAPLEAVSLWMKVNRRRKVLLVTSGCARTRYRYRRCGHFLNAARDKGDE